MDDELEKIQNKCLILSGILDGKTDRFEPDPTLDELQVHVRSARARIQKMITDEENQDRAGQLLTINDLINGVLHNYDVFKSGDGDKREITLGDHNPSSSVGDSFGAICLIDFDDDPVASSEPASNVNTVQQMGDLFGDLDFSGSAPAPPVKPMSTGLSDLDSLFAAGPSASAVKSSPPKKNGMRGVGLLY